MRMQFGFIGGAQVIQRQPGGNQLLNRADKLMYVLFNWFIVLSCSLFVGYDGTSLYTSFCSLMGYTTPLTSKLVDTLSNLELFSNLLEAMYPG